MVVYRKFKKFKKYTRFKPKVYRVFFQKRYWKKTRKPIKGWKYTKTALNWFKSKNIKAYAKRIK